MNATCSVWRGPDIGGQHLDARLLMRLLAQASRHLLCHLRLYRQQLLAAQTQGVEDALALGMLGGQTESHCCYHGCALAAAKLGLQEAHVAIGHKAAYHLIELSGKPERRGED